MFLFDYHTHTGFSCDSEESLERMCEKAIQLGLRELAITDHADFLTHGVFEDEIDLEKRQTAMQTAQQKYAGQLVLRNGIELGQPQANPKEYRRLMENYSFDFIIGSTHIVDFMDPYDAIYFETYPARLGLAHYFEDILKNISSFNHYCVYGHLDYAARYIKDPSFEFHYRDYSDLLDAILKMIIENGKGIEVNTAGLKYGMSDPNPHHEIIKRYMELGGEIITIGSDGHCPKHMAYDFYKLPDFLSNLGIRYYTVFRDKKPEFIKL